MKPQAYVFDLGGVLVRFDESLLLRCFRPEVTAADWWRFVLHSPSFRGFELGTISTEEMARAAVAELGAPGVSEPAFLTALAAWPATLQDHAVETVLAARATGARVAMLSNTNPLHWGILGPTFAAHFDDLLLSFQTGALKPAPEAFAGVEARLGLPPAALAFFDDNPHNVAAARARGWQAHQVRGPVDILPVLAAHAR